MGSNKIYVKENLKLLYFSPAREEEKRYIKPSCKEQITFCGKTAMTLLVKKEERSKRRKRLKYRSDFPTYRRAECSLLMLEDGIGAGHMWSVGFAHPE